MATKAMTQTQLLRHLAESCQLSNTVVRQFMETLAETALKETKKNGLFVLPGIGRLVKSKRKARMGRNPGTGAAIKIAAKTVVKFRVARPPRTPSLQARPKRSNIVVLTGSSEAGRSSHRVPSGWRTRDGMLCARGDGAVPVPRSSLPVAFPASPFGFPLTIST